jgi:sugar lactone lactonase YvrE
VGPEAVMTDIELVYSADRVVFESPVFDPQHRRIMFADLRDGTLFTFYEDSGKIETRELGGPVGSFGMCASGRIVVAQGRTVSVVDLDSGERETLVADIDEPPGNRFNDGKVGPDGCFWVGTRDARRDAGRVPHGNASLYRITPDGRIERKSTGYATSNGLAFTPDGRTMYHADSHNGRVDAWDLDPVTGQISGRRVLATLATGEGRPDGAACDSEGYYWSAGVSAGCLNRFAPDGRIVAKIALPCPKPTMTCFSDDYLYVTSMKDQRGGPGFVADLQMADISGYRHNVTGLFRMRAPVRGARQSVFGDG